MIAFGIERSGHAQDVTRAIGFTYATAFAASRDKGDLPMRDHDLVVVKWNSPKFQVAPPWEKKTQANLRGWRAPAVDWPELGLA